MDIWRVLAAIDRLVSGELFTNTKQNERMPHTVLYSPAMVFPWQRTPTTFDALQVVVLEYVQSVS